MKKLLFISTLLLANIQLGYSQENKNIQVSQNCDSQLVVEKNRNVRSVDEEGTTFPLVLTNNSSSEQVYSLSSIQLKEKCDTKNRRTSKKNSVLNISFLESDLKRPLENKVSIKSRQAYKFNAYIEVPKDTPYNTWGCISIEAKSKNCKNTISTQLRIYLPNPLEE